MHLLVCLSVRALPCGVRIEAPFTCVRVAVPRTLTHIHAHTHTCALILWVALQDAAKLVKASVVVDGKPPPPATGGKLIEKEERETGVVSAQIYWAYILASGGAVFVVLYVPSVCLCLCLLSYLCLYLCLSVPLPVPASVSVPVPVLVPVPVPVCASACACICICACTCACICVYVSACIHAWLVRRGLHAARFCPSW
jgi:hypothetical protein